MMLHKFQLEKKSVELLSFNLFLWFQVLDVAVSLAKVADVDRSIGNEDVAVDGFQEAIKRLESLTLKPEEAGLEQRVRFLFQLLVVSSLDYENLDPTLFWHTAPFSAGIPQQPTFRKTTWINSQSLGLLEKCKTIWWNKIAYCICIYASNKAQASQVSLYIKRFRE